MLGQLFKTLQQIFALRPVLHMGLHHGFRIRYGLIELHVFDVFLDVFLERLHGLAQLRHCPLSLEFRIAVACHRTPYDDRAEPVARQPYAVRQYNTRGAGIVYILLGR